MGSKYMAVVKTSDEKEAYVSKIRERTEDLSVGKQIKKLSTDSLELALNFVECAVREEEKGE